MLAFCNMSTLYLRDVPESVRDGLAELAAREGISVSAFAIRELAQVAKRANNAALLADLPHLDVSIEDVLADLDEGRGAR